MKLYKIRTQDGYWYAVIARDSEHAVLGLRLKLGLGTSTGILVCEPVKDGQVLTMLPGGLTFIGIDQ